MAGYRAAKIAAITWAFFVVLAGVAVVPAVAVGGGGVASQTGGDGNPWDA